MVTHAGKIGDKNFTIRTFCITTGEIRVSMTIYLQEKTSLFLMMAIIPLTRKTVRWWYLNVPATSPFLIQPTAVFQARELSHAGR
jgi:hypothetical protein